MSRVLAALRHHARAHPTRVALEDDAGALTYAELDNAVAQEGLKLLETGSRVVAVLGDNGRAWVLADLAAQWAGVPIVPLPPFMSPGQIAHALRTAGVDYVLTDQPERIRAAAPRQSQSVEAFHGDMVGLRLRVDQRLACALGDAYKITFTSGTTGEPKGVCLGLDELENTAAALCEASAASERDRHLCVLPLAILLENVGIYSAILAGATICVPHLAAVGMSGSSGLDALRLIGALEHWRATSAILVPQMALAMVAACAAGAPVPMTLRYLAVGGAPVSESLLQQARAMGLPLYEGYGLSECASVVAVNRLGANRIGSVGRPLPHVRIGFATDGEILVGGIRWLGYLGSEVGAGRSGTAIATGDLGYLDSEGYLHLTGRKKNIFVTSFGRNVAPEWVERELIAQAPILQAAIFGEARPFNTAVIVPRPDATEQSIARALDAANEGLPDYARVRAWIKAEEPFSTANGMATANGRLHRTMIFSTYAAQIGTQYDNPSDVGAP